MQRPADPHSVQLGINRRRRRRRRRRKEEEGEEEEEEEEEDKEEEEEEEEEEEKKKEQLTVRCLHKHLVSGPLDPGMSDSGPVHRPLSPRG